MDEPAPRQGRRPCLRCGKTFMSRDLTRNKICGPCNKKNEKEYDERPASSSVWVNGRRVQLPEEG